MTGELIEFARALIERADQDQGDQARLKAQFMRDFEALPLSLRMRVLREMGRAVFGRSRPIDD